jgi:hypothetical protein
MPRKTSVHRVEERQQVANKSKEDRAARTDKEQLDLLDIRFGKDKGAAKERARLLARINKV